MAPQQSLPVTAHPAKIERCGQCEHYTTTYTYHCHVNPYIDINAYSKPCKHGTWRTQA